MGSKWSIAEINPSTPVETRSSMLMLSGRRAWIRRAISRTWGKCSRMRRSRSSSVISPDTVYPYIWFHPSSCNFLCGRSRPAGGARQYQLQHALGAGGFEILGNALARGEEGQRLAGACRFTEDRPVGPGFIEFREQKVQRPKNLESIHHAREVWRLHGGREHEVRVDIAARGQKLRQTFGILQVAVGQPRCIDEDQFLSAVFLDRLRQRRYRFEQLKTDAEDGGVGAQLIGGGDAVGIYGEQQDGPASGEAVVHRQFDQRSGLARPGRPHQSHDARRLAG